MSDAGVNRVCDRAIGAIAEGNNQALSDIYDCMGKQIYFIAYSILKNHHDAEDVLQAVLIEIIESSPAYEKGSNARAWIMSIARNTALKACRERKPNVSLEDISEDARFAADDSEFLSSLTMFEALKTLPAEESEIVLLHIESGMKFREIGALLGITGATAQKKYRRALAKLKKYYSTQQKK